MTSRTQTTLLLMPAFAMLALVFAAPLAWFFAQILVLDPDAEPLWSQIVSVVTTRAVLQAIVTTNWIALVVTWAVLILGYPVAYYLANRSGPRFSLVIF